VNPARSDYKILVRAIDGQGRVEGWEPRKIFPNGATGRQALKLVVT
jgi:hypothetical protein